MKFPNVSLHYLLFSFLISGLLGSSGCKAPTATPAEKGTSSQSFDSVARDNDGGRKDDPSRLKVDTTQKRPIEAGVLLRSDSVTRDSTREGGDGPSQKAHRNSREKEKKRKQRSASRQ